MGIKLRRNDLDIFTDLADDRILLLEQLSILRSRPESGLRRRLKQLSAEDYVEELPPLLRPQRGNPFHLFGLGKRGFTALVKGEILSDALKFDQVSGSALFQQVEHQLLTNWFRIHLRIMNQTLPRFSCEFLAENSPFAFDLQRQVPLVWENLSEPHATTEESVSFCPDGVFMILDRETQRALLFFLEVDMGTEPCASARTKRSDIVGKIETYQKYFAAGAYKRYERHWGTEFTGFRVLFLCNTASRVAVLNRTIRAIGHTDFVWTSDQGQMFKQGVSGAIWFRGGKSDSSGHSILGSLGQPAPIPPSKRREEC